MFFVILAIGLTAAIISVHVNYIEKSVCEWPLRMRLKTLIAVLATHLRASLPLTVTEFISETKWSGSSRQLRPLNAIQRLDSASRGLLGSRSLLFTTPGGIVSFADGLIVTNSLALDLLTQQTIRSISIVRLRDYRRSSDRAFTPVSVASVKYDASNDFIFKMRYTYVTGL